MIGPGTAVESLGARGFAEGLAAADAKFETTWS